MEVKPAKISVLVTCYNRRNYVIDALSSVSAQMTKVPFEVILVKNFWDEEIDSYCGAKSVKVIYDESEIMGEMYLRGLQQCSGDLVVFLDDDDQFLPDKLEKVDEYFRVHRNLGFLHNSFTAVDEHSKPTVDRRHQHPSVDVILPASSISGETLAKFERYAGNVNMSSIAMKKSIIMSHLDPLREMWGVPETFLAYLAWTENSDVMLSQSVLTRYRIHIGESKGNFEDRNKMKLHLISLQNKYVMSYSVLSTLGKNPKLKQSIFYRVLVSRLRLQILETKRFNAVNIRESFELLSSNETRLLSVSLIIFNAIHILAPRLFSDAYLFFRRQLISRNFNI